MVRTSENMFQNCQSDCSATASTGPLRSKADFLLPSADELAARAASSAAASEAFSGLEGGFVSVRTGTVSCGAPRAASPRWYTSPICADVLPERL